MSRTTAVYVHIAGRVFAPGDVVPDEYAEKVSNPAVWGGEASAKSAPAPASAMRDGEPPRSGKGSGREVWSAYALTRGLDVSEGTTRDDIIAALAEAGKIEAGE